MKSIRQLAVNGVVLAGLASGLCLAQSNPDTSSPPVSPSTTQPGTTTPNGASGMASDTPTTNSNNYDSNRGGDHNFGWIGLIGLAGLAGLVRSNRRDVADTRTNDTRL
jgi:hypothetical protein